MATEDLNGRIDTAKLVNRWSFAGLMVLAVGGVVHAQLTFVPETRQVRERRIPEAVKAAPDVSVVPGGALLGVSGSF